MDIHAALKAPPRVVDTIAAWAFEQIAAALLGRVEKRYENWLSMSKEKGTGKHFKKQYADKAKITKDLLDEIKKYAKTATEEPLAFKVLPLDLGGWPYRLPKKSPTEVGAFVFFTHPTVKFGAAQFSENPDANSESIGGVTVYASQKGLDDIFVASDFKRALRRIETSIEHECQHLSQALLRRSTGLDSAGHPDKRPPTNEPYDPFTEPEKYHLDPREFWPMMDSIAREMKMKLEDVSEPQKATELRRLIDKEPMLKTLHQKDRALWMKAVRELTKKLGPEGMTVRLAVRFSY